MDNVKSIDICCENFTFWGISEVLKTNPKMKLYIACYVSIIYNYMFLNTFCVICWVVRNTLQLRDMPQNNQVGNRQAELEVAKFWWTAFPIYPSRFFLKFYGSRLDDSDCIYSDSDDIIFNCILSLQNSIMRPVIAFSAREADLCQNWVKTRFLCPSPWLRRNWT